MNIRSTILLLLWVMTPSFLQAADIKSDHFRLENGMEVALIPNHRVPAVYHAVFYKIGAFDEPLGKSSIAHFFEHLMFKGTEKFPNGEFSSTIAKNGGYDNAFTASDFTGYFQVVPKEKLSLVMEMEADRMQHLKMEDEEVEKERRVILEERNTRRNHPRNMLSEQVNAALYLNHPYGRPLIGWMHEIESVNKEDILSFYKTYYAPNNAILVVSGDMTVEELKPLAEQYYGSLEPQEIPERLKVFEPEHTAPRHISLHNNRVKKPEFIRQYLAPSQRYGDVSHTYALALLAHILGGGETSRLYQELVVNQQIAFQASAYYDDLRLGPGDFSIDIIPADGESLEKVEQELEAVIKKILDWGVTEEELQRAKTLLTAETIYTQDGFQAMGMIFGRVLSIGLPPIYIKDWEDRINAVTTEDVMKAAQHIFKEKSSVTGYLKPGKESL